MGDCRLSVRLALVVFALAACSPETVGPVGSASIANATPSAARTLAVAAVTARTFQARAGAVDPIAASTPPSTQDFVHVQLAAFAGFVTIHFVNAAPQSITVLDEKSDEDLYHVGSRLGPTPVLHEPSCYHFRVLDPRLPLSCHPMSPKIRGAWSY